MKLKRLQMQGFKSFADKTDLVLSGDDVVGVVGPNGCGKSNIVDCIRWAMGEQSAKGLRGKEMSDVIFAGTPSRKAGGFAEVSLTFLNSDKSAPSPYTDCEEIMVTRRLYRTGESEYLINKVTVRLKDVHDLFLGTGSSAKAYSIVAQGKVDQVVLAKPEDRRFLIEEAAGIAKYKVRKVSAERKMEATKKNLERVQDILKELDRNARSLERQVEKAEKFRELQRELKGLDEQIITAKVHKVDRVAGENEASLAEKQDAYQKAKTSLQEIEGRLEKLRFESLHQEKVTNTDYEQLMSTKDSLSRLETDRELAAQKVQILKNQILEREKDISRLHEKTKGQEQVREKLREEILEFEKSRTEKSEALEGLKTSLDLTSAKVEDTENQIKELQSLIDEIRTRVARERQKLEMLKSERVQLEMTRAEKERKLEESQVLLTEVHSRVEALNLRISEFESKDEQLQASIEEMERERTTYETNRDELLEHRQVLSGKRSDTDAKLDSLKTLEEHKVGYDPGALRHKEISNQSFLMDEVEFLPEHRDLGELLMYHVGQYFLGHDSVTDGEEFRWSQFQALSTGYTPANFEKSAVSLVQSCRSNDVRKILESIELVEELGNTAPHPQLDRKGNFRSPFGPSFSVLSQGRLNKDESPFARRQEKERLLLDKEELDRNYVALAEQISELESRLGENKRLREESRKEKEALKVELKAIVHEREERSQERASKESLIQQFQESISDLDRRLNQLVGQISEVQGEKELESLLTNKEALQAKLVEARSSKEDLESKWMEGRIELGAIVEKIDRVKQQSIDLDMTRSEYDHNESIFRQDIENWQTEIRELSESVEKSASLQAESRERLAGLEQSLAVAKEKLTYFHREIEENETERKQKQALCDELRQTVNDLEMQRQELRFQVEELSQVLMERYSMELSELLEKMKEEDLSSLDDDEHLKEMEENAGYLRGRISKFGDVNLVALQEYEEIKKRLDFMNSQREDLLKTLDSLQSIIDRINQITEFRFRETFTAINHNFQLLFPKLFGGGKAFMKLTDESNLLETGIEILAEPPGKRIQAMSLLSGGEKAMTSISLLLSLFAYRPSSFCILDEVDAPLDDVNTRRYNDIIREMSSLSQFIVITHNKRTMEICGTLFGVTMQEPGCSKLVGVNLTEARSFAASA